MSRGDAIRSRTGADAKRGSLSLNRRRIASFYIRTPLGRIRSSAVHTGPVWIGPKRDQIKNTTKGYFYTKITKRLI